MIIMETERLVLRELEESDYDALYSVLGDRDIMRHYPYSFDRERVTNWILRNRERYRIYGFGLWALCLKESGEMIGDCGLTFQPILPVQGVLKPEIGYHLRADMQHKGYAREAAAAVRDWTLANTPFKKIYSYMYTANEPSSAVARSMGMSLETEYTNEDGIRISVYCLDRSAEKT